MKLIKRTVKKEYMRDREVYIKVPEDKEYLVTIRFRGRVIKQFTTRPVKKRVKGGRYEYNYIRVMLPWSSTLWKRTGRWTGDIEITVEEPGKRRRRNNNTSASIRSQLVFY